MHVNSSTDYTISTNSKMDIYYRMIIFYTRWCIRGQLALDLSLLRHAPEQSQTKSINLAYTREEICTQHVYVVFPHVTQQKRSEKALQQVAQ